MSSRSLFLHQVLSATRKKIGEKKKRKRKAGEEIKNKK
jgi:hypothetical protein